MKKYLLSLAFSLCLLQGSMAQIRKSISILGDSYSTYQDYLQPDSNYVWYKEPADLKRTDVTSVRQTWWHKLISKNDYKLCVNNSFSGATICYTGYRKEDYSDRSFITRLPKLGNPDIIFIFGATNDSWAKSPIGEYKYADWTKDDLYSFRPAMACLLERAKEHYPNVDIYFILNTELSEEITESCKELCKHYSIDCIELKEIDKKSGHPSIKGMEQISIQIENYLKTKGEKLAFFPQK